MDFKPLFYYASMLEPTYFIGLATYSSWISVGHVCPCSTYHRWRNLTLFNYIVGVQASFHIYIGTYVKQAWEKQSKLEDVCFFYKLNNIQSFLYLYFLAMFELVTNHYFFCDTTMVMRAFPLGVSPN